MRIFKLLLCFSLLVLGYSLCEGQSWQWVKNGFYNGNNAGMSTSCAADKHGNIYMTGYFQDTISFGSFVLKSVNVNTFIVKYDPSGNVIWAKQANLLQKKSSVYAYSLAIDTSGNIYVTGSFSDSISFGGDTLYTYLASLYGTSGVFLAKFSPAGNIIWDRQSLPVNEGNGYPTFVATDLKNNVYITGEFFDTIKFGNLLVSDTNFLEIFLVKFDANGISQWVRKSKVNPESIPFIDEPYSIATDKEDNVIIGGNIWNCSLYFNTFKLKNPANIEGFFLAKYDSSGNVLWAKQSISTNGTVGFGSVLATDETGNIYITGDCTGNVTYDNFTFPSPSHFLENLFLVKISPAGNFIWAKYDSSNISSNNDFTFWIGLEIATDDLNNVYLFQNGTSFNNNTNNPEPLNYTLYIDSIGFNINNYDGWAGLFVKFDSSGKVICGSTLNGLDAGLVFPAGQICAGDSLGKSVYFCSNTESDTYGDSLLFGNDTLNTSSWKKTSPFIAKWQPCGNSDMGINEILPQKYSISLFPNPNHGQFTIQSSAISGQCSVEVYNVFGQKVFTSTLPPPNGGGASISYEINLSSQPNGVYFYRVTDGKGDLIGEGKFVVEK